MATMLVAVRKAMAPDLPCFRERVLFYLQLLRKHAVAKVLSMCQRWRSTWPLTGETGERSFFSPFQN